LVFIEYPCLRLLWLFAACMGRDRDRGRDRGRDRDRTGWRLHGGAPIPYFPPQRTSAFSFCARFSMR
jgi:hypothetical protein